MVDVGVVKRKRVVVEDLKVKVMLCFVGSAACKRKFRNHFDTGFFALGKKDSYILHERALPPSLLRKTDHCGKYHDVKTWTKWLLLLFSCLFFVTSRIFEAESPCTYSCTRLYTETQF